jgi:hypothetical protein
MKVIVTKCLSLRTPSKVPSLLSNLLQLTELKVLNAGVVRIVALV